MCRVDAAVPARDAPMLRRRRHRNERQAVGAVFQVGLRQSLCLQTSSLPVTVEQENARATSFAPAWPPRESHDATRPTKFTLAPILAGGGGSVPSSRDRLSGSRDGSDGGDRGQCNW
jgi:hypothetical protein